MNLGANGMTNTYVQKILGDLPGPNMQLYHRAYPSSMYVASNIDDEAYQTSKEQPTKMAEQTGHNGSELFEPYLKMLLYSPFSRQQMHW